jgi:hypothetical protein
MQCIAVIGAGDEESRVSEALRTVRAGAPGDYVYLHDENPAVRRMTLRSGVGMVAECKVERAAPREEQATAGARCWKISKLPAIGSEP